MRFEKGKTKFDLMDNIECVLIDLKRATDMLGIIYGYFNNDNPSEMEIRYAYFDLRVLIGYLYDIHCDNVDDLHDAFYALHDLMFCKGKKDESCD